MLARRDSKGGKKRRRILAHKRGSVWWNRRSKQTANTNFENLAQ